ncbi:Fibronectin type III domain-containing protein 5 [Larimichthys crocea]|uniref:Uncharacterized protein n=1 Tax=Larimichthys crocea TaxID=215358 RepID=A0ACD3QY33_LARCR|nr:Fibronectin type III domain-containing protein 5 [Larimichthys crocea]
MPDRPPAPVNVSVMHLRADSATVSWEVPEGDIIIGFSISQQNKTCHGGFVKTKQRDRRDTCNDSFGKSTPPAALVFSGTWRRRQTTSSKSSQLASMGKAKPAKRSIFAPLKRQTASPPTAPNQDDPTVQGLDKSRHLQTGEMIIIVVVLVMWAAVIALFCRQYDIIKDNDSSNNKEKAKPSSERSTPEHHSGGLLRSKFHPSVPSINIIEV